MINQSVYTVMETKDDIHAASGDFFFREESDNQVVWRLARFSYETDEQAVKKIWEDGYYRLLAHGGNEYHRVKFFTFGSVIRKLIARHMGIPVEKVKEILSQ